MTAKELAEKINSEIQKRQTSTTSILRDARTLGKLLRTRDFEWVEKELKGYEAGSDIVPIYRNVNAIESKVWTSHLNTDIQRIHSDWLKSKQWMKWILTQSVSELEDLLTSGYEVNTGTIFKTLGLTTYSQVPIYQFITVYGTEIKKVLDQIQDNVQAQVSEILATPKSTAPSVGIFLIYLERFPEMKDDFRIIGDFLETGQEHLLAARACRPILHALIRGIIKSKLPKNYTFQDGVPLNNSGEKSKIKYYLEKKGEILFKDKKKILFIDDIFRELYEISSKADKNKVNIYEANYCVDKLIQFLEQLFRFTDLNSI